MSERTTIQSHFFFMKVRLPYVFTIIITTRGSHSLPLMHGSITAVNRRPTGTFSLSRWSVACVQRTLLSDWSFPFNILIARKLSYGEYNDTAKLTDSMILCTSWIIFSQFSYGLMQGHLFPKFFCFSLN